MVAGVVIGQACGKNCLVTARQEFDHPRFESTVTVPRQAGSMGGAAQEGLHLSRPVLLFDLHEGSQFAKVVRVAQCVFDTRHGVVGLPVIMHDDAIHFDVVGKQAAALRGKPPLQN